MAKKNALGKGLGALIKQSEASISERQTYSTDKIDIRLIVVNPFQPRTIFDSESLEEMASSIKQLGIIQPITVREVDDGKYQIISGERRYRASLMAGLTEMPAYVRQADDSNMLEMALVENIQREDLNAIEIAISYQRLIDECQLTQQTVSKRVGKKRSTITNYLRLLKLPPEIQLAVKQEQISMGHGRALVNIETAEQQLQLFHQIIENALSVRQVESAVRKINQPEEEQPAEQPAEQPTATAEASAATEMSAAAEEPAAAEAGVAEEESAAAETVREDSPFDETLVYEDPNPSESVPGDEEEQALRERLSRCFGTKVELKRSASGTGRVVIPFRTDAEFQYILQMVEKLIET